MSDDFIPITTARSARDAALGPGALTRAANGGALTRLRRGAYVAPAHVAAIDQPSHHRLLVRASRLAAAGEPVFSHESAAALHGIPIIGDWPDAVVTTGAHGGRVGPVLRVRRPLGQGDVVIAADGSRVTSLARTAVDLAAKRSLLGGIVAVSHARFAGITLEELEASLKRLGPITGVARARRAIARSSAGSESALETLVVVRCQDYGFAPPEQQRPVIGIDGREYRIDFAWRDGMLLVDADGRAKYADPALRGGRSAEDVVWAEKRREDAIRATCERFLRITWAEAWAGVELARRFEAIGIPRTGRRLCALTF